MKRMKAYRAPLIGVIFFATGLFIGREFFPNPTKHGRKNHDAVEEQSALEDRRPLRVSKKSNANAGASTPGTNAIDVSRLMALVDATDTFETGNRMRDALGSLNVDQLVALLSDLEHEPKTNPKLRTTRSHLFNYLTLADPAWALDYVLEHSDKQFQQSFIATAMKGFAKADFPAARQALDRISDQYLQNMARNSLLNVALKSDPEALGELLREAAEAKNSPTSIAHSHHWNCHTPYISSWNYLSWDSFSLNTYNSHGIISQWAQKDPAAAETYALGLEKSSERSSALLQIAQARAQSDPEEALAWAKGLNKEDGRTNAIKNVMQTLAITEPQKAAKMLGEVTTLQERNSLINTVASAWIQKDREAALTWLKSLPTSNAKQNAYTTAIQQIGHEKPETAIRLLDKLPFDRRGNILQNIASTWAQKDWASARQWMTSLDDPIQIGPALNGMLSHWATTDPQEASAFLKNSSELSLPNQNHHYRQLARHWGQKDQDTALQWAQGIEDEGNRQAALNSLYQQWASSSPEDAVAKLHSVNDPMERKTLINSIASQWATQDPDATIQWYDSLHSEDKASITSSAINNLINYSPHNAAVLYDRMIADAGEDKKRLNQLSYQANSIARQWSQHEPAAAAQWAEQISNEKERIQAVEGVASSWIQLNPTEAAEWIDNLPVGEVRDGGAKCLINHVKEIDPASAFEWAQSINDEENRYRSIRNVVNQWKRTDKDSALEAVATADVTPEQRQEFQRLLK